MEEGLLIARVYRNGPAHKVGLHGATEEVHIGNYIVRAGGDIITAVSDTTVESMEDLTIYLETKTRIGDELTLTIWREGKERQTEITVSERPMR